MRRHVEFWYQVPPASGTLGTKPDDSCRRCRLSMLSPRYSTSISAARKDTSRCECQSGFLSLGQSLALTFQKHRLPAPLRREVILHIHRQGLLPSRSAIGAGCALQAKARDWRGHCPLRAVDAGMASASAWSRMCCSCTQSSPLFVKTAPGSTRIAIQRCCQDLVGDLVFVSLSQELRVQPRFSW